MKRFACIVFSAVFAFSAAALEVNREELKAQENAEVEFESFGGPYAVIETVEAIMGIGTDLGNKVSRDILSPLVVNPGEKYTLVHAVASDEQEKFSADILVLNENAGVDHIKNLRRIITGYLESAYGYTREDSETLAVFITVYNAVYRGNMENFSSKYSDAVLVNLTAEKAGLSTNWEDWAGNSQIVIPLGDFKNGTPVETSAISDEKVVEAIRTQEDKGIEVREKLADMKEKESVSASEKAKEAQKEAAQQRKEGNREAAEKAAQVSSKEQQLADRKTTEVRADRAEIKKDKEELAKADPVDSVTGLYSSDDKGGFYRLITVDALTGKILKKSPVTQIRSKAVYIVDNIKIENLEKETVEFKELYLAVCGENKKKSSVRLCLLDTENLELQKQSEEILSETSELIQNGSDFIAVIQDGKEYRAAIYTKDLVLKCKSAAAVKPDTPFNMTSKGLFVTDSKGNPLLLNPTDLTEFWGQGKTSVHETSGYAK